MNQTNRIAWELMLAGIIAAILLFTVSLILGAVQKDLAAANYFAGCGLRVLVLFGYISLGTAIARLILQRRGEQ
ncbi:MAG: hypothetical protein ACI4IV_00215 [Acutalibacteraceae bacterium]